MAKHCSLKKQCFEFSEILEILFLKIQIHSTCAKLGVYILHKSEMRYTYLSDWLMVKCMHQYLENQIKINILNVII